MKSDCRKSESAVYNSSTVIMAVVRYPLAVIRLPLAVIRLPLSVVLGCFTRVPAITILQIWVVDEWMHERTEHYGKRTTENGQRKTDNG